MVLPYQFYGLQHEHIIFDNKWFAFFKINFCIGRLVSIKLNCLEYFYEFACGIIDYINSTEKFVYANGLAIELKNAAIADDFPEHGYYILFRSYVGQRNISYATVHCLRTLGYILFSNRKITGFIYRGTLTSYFNLMLDLDYQAEIEKVYNHLIKDRTNEEKLRLPVQIGYFIFKLRRRILNFDSFLDFLSKNITEILKLKSPSLIGWLQVLTLLKKQLGNEPEKKSAIDIYIDRICKKLPTKFANHIAGLHFSTSDLLRKQLINKIVQVDQNVNNFELESIGWYNKHDLMQLTEFSYQNQNQDEFLLANYLKSDLTINRKGEGKFIYSIPKESIDSSRVDYFQNLKSHIISDFKLENEDGIVFLNRADEKKVMYLFLNGQAYSEIRIIEGWNNSLISKWESNSYSELLPPNIFDNPKQSSFFDEDYFEHYNHIIGSLQFAKLDTPSLSRLFFIKDIGLNSFPNHLFLDGAMEFIGHKMPVCDLVSIDWFTRQKNMDQLLMSGFSKGIYIPIDFEDQTLKRLYDRIKEFCVDNSFAITTSEFPASPLGYDLNVFCAHGFDYIHFFNVLHSADNYVIGNLEKVSGKGKIGILLICHAGSTHSEHLTHKSRSLVRAFLDMGYSTLIAPFWSLDIRVAEQWLKEFYSNFHSGQNVVDSVFRANLVIHEKYHYPGAWACMHIYGNPYWHTKIMIH